MDCIYISDAVAALQTPSRRGLLAVEQTGGEVLVQKQKLGSFGSWLQFVRWAIEYLFYFFLTDMTMLCRP